MQEVCEGRRGPRCWSHCCCCAGGVCLPDGAGALKGGSLDGVWTKQCKRCTYALAAQGSANGGSVRARARPHPFRAHACAKDPSSDSRQRCTAPLGCRRRTDRSPRRRVRTSSQWAGRSSRPTCSQRRTMQATQNMVSARAPRRGGKRRAAAGSIGNAHPASVEGLRADLQ